MRLHSLKHDYCKKKFFHKNFATLRNICAYLWTPDQKQFLAAILNSGAILFFGV
jgi:hypothetical protein